MLIGRLGSQAGGLWFLESAICSLVGETGLEARAGSLERRTRDQGPGDSGTVACWLVVRIECWALGGQGHVQR